VSFVHWQSDSGLVIATEGADETAARHALMEHDRDLRLVPQNSDAYGRRIYKVYRYRGPDRPAEFVLFWGDPSTGEPYPLSVTGLLEKVKQQDRNLRGDRVTLEQLEQRRRVEQQKDARRELDALVDEHRDRVDGRKSQPLARSRSLYLARNRVRARTPDPDMRP
jgi:hypothetical protein